MRRIFCEGKDAYCMACGVIVHNALISEWRLHCRGTENDELRRLFIFKVNCSSSFEDGKWVGGVGRSMARHA
jgi:hypothetical protein